MKKRSFALLSAAALMAVAVAGCSSNKTAETTAPAATETQKETQTAETEAATEASGNAAKKVELLVAGGDGAGLVAAIQAVREGMDPSKVIIVEKSKELGADIASMGDFMNASNTDEQFNQEVEDSFETYLADIKKAGNDKNNSELAEFVAENSEEALDWLREAGIELEGVTKQEGSSLARSYAATGDKKLSEALTEMLLKEAETLKIQIMTETSIDKILFGNDGRLAGVTITGKDGQETLETVSLLLTDKELLPLLKEAPLVFTEDSDKNATGLVVNNCAEVIGDGEETVPGLYAAGSIIDAAVFGEKALAGNQITSMVLLGATAGTESAVYVSDNK